MSKRWIAFFSQSGNEIDAVSKHLGIYPWLCITNRTDLNGVNSDLIHNTTIVRTSKKPTVNEYVQCIGDSDNTIITLNGWLRIIPGNLCRLYEMWNGHPGLITKYPELKGKDPQQKAIALGLKSSGCIIHRVTPEVDSGEIVASKEIQIENLEPADVFSKLHETSVNLWVEFLKTKI